jgi:SAM-dependent methyltransferase
MNLLRMMMDQYRKPAGWIGRAVAGGMNRWHAALTDWGLARTGIRDDAVILDVGCGGGETVRKLADAHPHSRVHGIDYSAESIAVSARRNAQGIRAGRVDIRRASVTDLPFPEGMFDLVLAVETHYFWPDLSSGLREILRVTKPGGKVSVIGEGYAGGKYDDRNRKLSERADMSFYGIREFGGFLSAAGFTDVLLFEEYEKGWFCATARKPG